MYDACGHPLLLPGPGKRPNSKPPPRPQQPKPTDPPAPDSAKRPRPILKKRDSSLAPDCRAPLGGRSPRQEAPPLKRSGSSAALLLGRKAVGAASPDSRPSSPPYRASTALERVASFTSVATAIRRKPLVKSQSLDDPPPQRPPVNSKATGVVTPTPTGENHDRTPSRRSARSRQGERKGGERNSGGGGMAQAQVPGRTPLQDLNEEEEKSAVDGLDPQMEPSKPKRLMKKLLML